MRVIFKLLLALLLVLPLCAQSWDALRGLKAGERVRVTEVSGASQNGTFAAVSDTAITLETKRGQAAIERARVKRVEVRSNAKRARNILIGAGIGVAVGATIDQTLGTYFRNESGETAGARALTYIAPIAIFGAIGSLPAYRTIYRVR